MIGRLVSIRGFGLRACHLRPILAVLTVVLALSVPEIASAAPDLSVTTSVLNEDGSVDFSSGSHPFEYAIHISSSGGEGATAEFEEAMRRFSVTLPPGLVANLRAIPQCSSLQFDGPSPHCPGSSQIGVVEAAIAGFGVVRVPLYDLSDSFGTLGTLAFSANQVTVLERVSLDPEAERATLSGVVPIEGVTSVSETIWGTPGDAGHDSERTCIGAEGEPEEGCAISGTARPILTSPTNCSGPLETIVSIEFANKESTTAVGLSRDAGGNPLALIGCGAVPFSPRLAAVLETPLADSPTGLSLTLERPELGRETQRSEATVFGVRIDLPEGLVIDPAAAAGLQGCPAGADPCPPASKVGTAYVKTQLLDHRLEGSIYLAQPEENPFGSLFALYVLFQDEESGTTIRLPARIGVDPATGRLSATLTGMPPFPFEEMQLAFRGGPRSVVSTPARCGSYPASTIFAPSSAPEGESLDRTVTIDVTAPGGAKCPASEAGLPTATSFSAGSSAPAAGESAGLILSLGREDGTQRLGSFEATLPPGLLAKVSDVATCSSEQIPACPANSKVGSVIVSAGSGPAPLTLEGRVYLARPYKGAPLSLVAVVPTRTEAFDFGPVVVRVALYVDAGTGQVRAVSDPLPEILRGVPLDLRGLDIDLDRPGFIRNPTSCEPMAITGSAISTLGQVTPLSSRFRVANCKGLPFHPRFSLLLVGGKGRGGHPGVRAVMSEGEGEATPANAGFNLPAGELLDLDRVRGLCPRSVPADRCPRGSLLGSVSLTSAYLPEPLTGSIYLQAPRHRLPDVVASLQSPSASLESTLSGRMTTSHGRLGVSLESLPDIPISSAVLSLVGGRRGILVNSHSLCGKRASVVASFSAHNGMRRRQRVPVRVGGCG
jgi:hypothetical protein